MKPAKKRSRNPGGYIGEAMRLAKKPRKPRPKLCQWCMGKIGPDGCACTEKPRPAKASAMGVARGWASADAPTITTHFQISSDQYPVLIASPGYRVVSEEAVEMLWKAIPPKKDRGAHSLGMVEVLRTLGLEPRT